MLNKKLRSYKDSLVLTNDMRGIIVGLLLGDANKDSKGWRINISTKSYDKFYDLVQPYVIPSMTYKLPNKK